ncbi:calcium-binding protein [Paracraurococcus lichenis]|uniref:Calcium-binding protein n=1 Tax=Paracraurococcus lichenis TaxID=3064888 RepID=A0ABT9E8C8_9PROT|nr:hypothetical protein [Paracraurococcus sp. LOR1-02]MDO9712429.1 hypothetical protein [Paracraurococcus sp. LOR1-02]
MAFLRGTPGDDNLSGTPGPDIIAGLAGSDHLTGLAGDDSLIGGAGADVLSGLAGDDLLIGGPGNDELLGGYGRDTLLGGPGDDILEGNVGADLLVGGAGADRFFFAPTVIYDESARLQVADADTGFGPGKRDVILDFVQGEDTILLSYNTRDFSFGAPANPALPVFLGTAPFSGEDAALQVRYDIAHGRTVVEFLGPTLAAPLPDGETRFHGEIELAGVHHLTSQDLLLA